MPSEKDFYSDSGFDVGPQVGREGGREGGRASFFLALAVSLVILKRKEGRRSQHPLPSGDSSRIPLFLPSLPPSLPPSSTTKQGSKILHNCLAYKLCYHRFGEMSTDYGKPPG